MNYLMLVNKDNLLDMDFIPSSLVEVVSKYKDGIWLDKCCYDNFLKMQECAKSFGYEIDVMSGYRNYLYQEKLYQRLVNEKGFNYAISRVAVPGGSEHQTGLAVDFCVYKNGKCYIEDEIDELEETRWVHQNCYKYGFILRYPFDKENITKYSYEPWHLRYVGDCSYYIYNNDITLEEYLNK